MAGSSILTRDGDEIISDRDWRCSRQRFEVKPLDMGGLRPGIDLSNSAELLDIMESSNEDDRG